MPAPIRLCNLDLASVDSEFSSVGTVSVALGDLLPVLMHAALTRRAWLEDFSDDTIQITQDLYEVVLAHQQRAAA